MKILWLSHLVPYPPKGGVLQRSYHLLHELSRYHSVDLLAFNQKPLMRTHYPDIETGLRDAGKHLGEFCGRVSFHELPADRARFGRHWIALKSLVSQPYNINWLDSAPYARELAAWLADGNYDLVHFDTISLIPYRRLLPAQIATALDHHNIESEMLLRRAALEKSWLKRAYFWQEGVRLKHYEATQCATFSTNITCSDLDTERLKAICPACDAQTIPNGVDIDYFSPGTEDKAFSLIFVGRLNWYPNTQAVNFIAEQLWPLIRKRWPNAVFNIIGANPPKSARDLAQQDPQFRVHGFVDDVRPMMAAATLYICPITDGGGTKLKMLDALAMGKVIVADPIACEGIAVTRDKDVAFASTPQQYMDEIAKLLDAPEKRIAMGAAARQLIESQYSYRAIGKTLAALYESYQCKT